MAEHIRIQRIAARIPWFGSNLGYVYSFESCGASEVLQLNSFDPVTSFFDRDVIRAHNNGAFA
jgi:hypothetical protein